MNKKYKSQNIILPESCAKSVVKKSLNLTKRYETLLNCGIIGGNASLMFDFIKRLWSIHQHANYANETAFTGDMGAFNYLVRTQFNEQLRHGAPVNTVFKMYENERTDCWFRHK